MVTTTKILQRHYYILFGIAYLVLLIWQPDSGYDKYFWMDWSGYIQANGLGNIYLNPEVNYHPFILYLLKIYTWINWSNIPEEAVNLFKLIIVVFDFASLILLLWLLKRWRLNLLWILILLLNPAFWYNTLIWGQTDTVYTFFIFAALVAFYNGDALITAIMVLLAVNTKMQAIIFVPFFIYLAIALGKEISWGRVALGLLATQALILLPFMLEGNLMVSLEAILGASLDQFPVLSRNAFNIWYLLNDDPFNASDGLKFLGIPSKYWGLSVFVLLYGAIIWLFHTKVKEVRNSARKLQLTSLAFVLITLCFFYFNTQMHERYSHAAILFAGLVTMLSGRCMLLAIISVGYLLNLEAVMQFMPYVMPVDGDSYADWFIFNPIIISVLFLSAIVIGFTQFFKFTPQKS